MKLTFTSKDNIYKIFKILKKIPHGKTVHIFLDDHPLLTQTRRIEAFVQQLQESALEVTVTTTSKIIAKHLQEHSITTICTAENKWDTWAKSLLPAIFFSWNNRLPSKEYLKSKLSLIAELLVLTIIVYIFWGTISPKATIRLEPAVYVQPLTYSFLYYPAGQSLPQITPLPLAIPIYSGQVHYRSSKTIDLSSFTTDLLAAKGTITLYNTLDEEFSLLEGTTLATSDGMLFTLDNRVRLPAGSESVPGKTRVTITAKEYQEDGTPIGELGNIAKDTRLWIQKLPESREQKSVRAEPLHAFTEGQTIISGTVVSADIEQLEKLLREDIQEELPGIIRKHLPANSLSLPISQEITVTTERFLTNAQPGESTSFLQGTMEVVIRYPYVHKDDLIGQTKAYIAQRASTQHALGGISIDSTVFYDPRPITTGSYTIPTTVQTFWGYDFEHDNHHLLTTLQKRLPGMSKKAALEAIVTLPEVQNASVSLSPPRYDTLPKSWEKINIVPQRLKVDNL